jgi:DNA polymerase-3 subunit beta
MKFTILKEYLNQAIQHVSRAISGRTAIPILNGIKIDVTSAGMVLTASDTEVTIQHFIPAEEGEERIITIEKTGSIVLPAKFFVEIIKKLPEQHVEMELKEPYQTIMKSGTAEIQMIGLDPEEYPALPAIAENNAITLPASVLKTMIKQTVFAVSANESTPVLTGVLWTLSGQTLKFVATDRHRLATRQIKIDADPSLTFENIVIPGKTLNELYKIIPDQNLLADIVVADNQVLFRLGNILFYSRVLEGVYPDTSKIIPQTYKTEMIVNTKAFLEAMDRAYLLSREEKTNIVKLVTKEDGSLEISSSLSELGKITEQLPTAEMKGEPVKISFNSKYMLDALKVLDSEQIQIGFTGMMSPIIVKPDDSADVLHLILPYRTVN